LSLPPNAIGLERAVCKSTQPQRMEKLCGINVYFSRLVLRSCWRLVYDTAALRGQCADAPRLRREATMTLKWMADRLKMKTKTGLKRVENENGSPISVSGQEEKKISGSQPFFLKAVFGLSGPLRAASKMQFVPVISVVDSDASLPLRR